MHIDLNSCFATIEQQANPLYRGKPIAVAAYTSGNGCILAPSIEAKRFGIKTGMRLREAKTLYPKLIALTPDPPKYRHVHLKLRRILKDYTNDFFSKSIDEFVLDLTGYPALGLNTMHGVGAQIKKRIKEEIGEWLTVSVGFGPSRFIAKTASSYKKPDGLIEINIDNFLDVYKSLSLVDLHGINVRNEIRLNSVGIRTVMDFYEAPLWKLKAAFSSIVGYYWFLRLRGYEIDSVEFARRSFGNSIALSSNAHLLSILQKLCEKTGSRVRKNGYQTRGVHLSLSFKDHSFWHKSEKLNREIFDSRDIYKNALRLFNLCKENEKPIHILAITCFNLVKVENIQEELFQNVEKRKALVDKIDGLNNKWGDYTVIAGNALKARDYLQDRIAFGGVSELK